MVTFLKGQNGGIAHNSSSHWYVLFYAQGKFWHTMGYAEHGKQFLLPEETLYLLECVSRISWAWMCMTYCVCAFWISNFFIFPAKGVEKGK